MSGAGVVYSLIGYRRYNKDHVQFELDETRHIEWITVIDQFEDSSATNISKVRSLNDLVDLAIDKHDRVVYCCTKHKYFFVDGNVQYEYKPDVRPSYANAFESSVPEKTTPEADDQENTEQPSVNEKNNSPEESGEESLSDNDSTENVD